MTNEREQKIIEQAVSYLEPITNSHRLRLRVHKAKEINTLEAFWDLHHDLTHPKSNIEGDNENYMKLLIGYQGEDNAVSYTRELSAILRGERLEN
jgi:hypothetical protein